MLDIAFRNTRRQKTRSILTIMGILIGIAAIVALGSMSEGINYMVEKQMETMVGKIMVTEKGASMFTGYSDSEISYDQLDDLRDMPGVKNVIPLIFHVMGAGGMQFRQPDMAIGIAPEHQGFFKGEKVGMHEGRELEEGDSGVAIAGKMYAENHQIEVGDYVTVEDEDFYIVGVVEKTDNGDIDYSVMIPLDELNDVLEMDTYPFVFVVPEDLDAVEDLGEDIKDTYEDFDVITGKEMARTVGEMMSNIRLFTFGIGAIAAIVGGLGVMNTMIMAVLERKREIGVFKAIGATNRMVLKQFMIESALLSLIGGATGILLGAAGSLLVGTATPIAPIVTLPLIGGALLFALLLGLFGGIYPAMKAAKLDPVEALRYE